jgi:hypothetical protein
VCRTRIRNGVAIGINPFTEWNHLRHHLSRNGNFKHFVAGDYSAFDGSQQKQVFCLVLKEINAWYDDGPDNARVREVLFMDLYHSRHVGGIGTKHETVYEWFKGMPSGHPATSVINSLNNLVLFCMAYGQVMGLGALPSFHDHVSVCTYGDDNVLGLSDQVSVHFNQHTLTDALASLGYTYTHEAKDSREVAPTRPLNEVTFIKRGFTHDEENGMLLCPLDIKSVVEQPYWCTNKKLELEIVQSSIDNMLRELSLHTIQVWREYADIIYSRCVERGFQPTLPNDRSLHRKACLDYIPSWSHLPTHDPI